MRTRRRSSKRAACHAPGCSNRASQGKSFCGSCQATLDRVRVELKSVGPKGRKPVVRKAA